MQWIPVSERMPPEDPGYKPMSIPVLIFWRDPDGEPMIRVGAYGFFYRHWQTLPDDEDTYDGLANVTHWMPLPDPPSP